MPKVSVIMLTCNREKLVGRAIESIERQTFNDFEFIIVDNGSTDRSSIIADEYAVNDKRINIIHRKRGNIGSGRNTGLDMATGEYIAFIDDDDYVQPDFLEFLYELAEQYAADIAICGSYKDEFGIVSPNYIYVYDKLYVMDAEEATGAFLQRKYYNAAMPTKLIKRAMFDKIRFSDIGNYDDITTTYRYFTNARRVAAHGIPKYTFYRHSGNNSSAATKHHLLNPVQLYEYLSAFRERTEYISDILPNLAEMSLWSEWSYMISMVEKIHRFNLTNCDEPLKYMQCELNEHRKEFLSNPWTQEFEKKWMDLYIMQGVKA